jgi:nucleoid-associated protein YgaU
VRQRFTLFSRSGIPLRATLTVTLKEYKTLEQQIDDIRFQSPDHTRTRVVQQGDTLSRIANDAYGDPAQWRAIAEQNQITDPLDLAPGRILDIPPLT